jgi:EAL domain-containing protein (putative c-di-GMP-specific phosphodiesterase class I)
LKVVAEGVETVEQQRFVASAGVYAMQGYLFARSMPSARLPAFLAELEDRVRAAMLAGR